MDQHSAISGIHSQTELLNEQQRQKHQSFDNFLDQLAANSFKGLLFGFGFGLVICGRNKFTRYAALGAGIGGGIALNECAHNFNRIHAREQHVLSYITRGKDDLEERLEHYKKTYLGK